MRKPAAGTAVPQVTAVSVLKSQLCRHPTAKVTLTSMTQHDSLTRRTLLRSGLGAAALAAQPLAALAAPAGFDAWRDGLRTRAMAKGISAATWNRVMGQLEPDMSVFKELKSQPEFKEQLWQYINRRVSDWRIINGKIALKDNAALF